MNAATEAESVRTWPGTVPATTTGRATLDPATVTLGELAVLGAAALLTALAVASLAAAHLHRFTLGHAVLGTAAAALVLAAAARAAGARAPRVVADLPGLGLLAGTAAFAAFMLLPGFHYAAGDRDPGGYVMTGATIARTGSVTFADPLLTSGLPVEEMGHARFRGIWVSDPAAGLITPQFYHLWSALLAVAARLHGFAGEVNVGPLLGVLAALLLACLGRRLGGPVAGIAAGVALPAGMLEVWQAKYPTAEVLAQVLYLGAALGLLLAVQTRWRWPALLAGVLTGAGWLARADGLLPVLLAVAALAGAWAVRRCGARCRWFAAGLAPLAGYAAYQAYGPAAPYTRDNHVPGWPVLAALVAACLVAAVLGRVAADRWRGRPRAELLRRVGLAVTAAYTALFCLALGRPLFGHAWMLAGSRAIRSYDELALYRLSWFLTWPGLLLVLAGLAFVAAAGWSPAPWVVLAPSLVLLPLYCWHARVAPFLMWWGRRFVPYALPGMVLLVALALAGLAGLRGWRRRWRDRLVPVLAGPVAAAGLAVFLAVSWLGQSLPLRQHDEWGGSYGVERDLAALSGGHQGVYLWQRERYCCAAPAALFAGPLWLLHDQVSVLTPPDPAALRGYVGAYLAHFADRPVFLVYDRAAPPPPLAGLRVTPVSELAGALPRWSEPETWRPASPVRIEFDIVVYRVSRA